LICHLHTIPVCLSTVEKILDFVLFDFYFLSVNSRKIAMDNVLEVIQDSILNAVLVAVFLFNTSRVPQAIELLKECLILLNNKVPQKRGEFTILI